MKEKILIFLRWICSFIGCFIVIYSIVFVGGWKLFERDTYIWANLYDIILIEIGASLILSVFVFVILEVMQMLYKRIEKLEKQIEELKNRDTID